MAIIGILTYTLVLVLLYLANQNLAIVTTNYHYKTSQIAFASNKNNSSIQTSGNNNTNIGNNTQVWVDKSNNVKIQFSYLPKYPFVDNVTELKFGVQNLQTENKTNYLKNLYARVTVINNVTAKFDNNIREPQNGDFYTFNNIIAPDGNFSIKYQFREAGVHQVITRIDSNDFLTLASFNVLVQPSE
jgi:hypothetical protein